MGRGDYRNYYKGPMDKTKGRVELGQGGGFSWGGVEGLGENADNSNNNEKFLKMKMLHVHLKRMCILLLGMKGSIYIS